MKRTNRVGGEEEVQMTAFEKETKSKNLCRKEHDKTEKRKQEGTEGRQKRERTEEQE